MRDPVRYALTVGALLAGAAGLPAQQPDSGMSMAMPGIGSGMPIPMPRGMRMMPGLVGLAPAVTPFLPGNGVNPATLPAALPSSPLDVQAGDTVDLTAMLVRRTIRGHDYVGYGFNGQVPGPLLRIPQGATVAIRFRNRIDLPSSIHWHGIRLDNRYDGVPGLTQPQLRPGDSLIYLVHAPDAGVFWYHPHEREDVEQPLGLAGGLLVEPRDPGFFAPVNEERVLVLSDLLINGDTLIPFGRETPDFALMGRSGNVLLINGETGYRLSVHPGDVVRFFLINASSSRTYNLSFGGASIKVVAGDQSRFEDEARVESVVIGPAERYVIEARFPAAGVYPVINAVQTINHFVGEFQAEVDTLGLVTAEGAAASPDYAASYAVLRRDAGLRREVDRLRAAIDRPPDKRLTLTLATHGLALTTVQFMSIDTAYYTPVEWNDAMPDMNWLSTADEVTWQLRDDATGKTNGDIDWHVPAGSFVKVRIFNDPKSFHPMQHPIHLHGQRMLVVERDGVKTTDFVWKDTVLIPVGSTVDVLVDASNPGAWMWHCHIAEHLGAGMMAVMHVDPK